MISDCGYCLGVAAVSSQLIAYSFPCLAVALMCERKFIIQEAPIRVATAKRLVCERK